MAPSSRVYRLVAKFLQAARRARKRRLRRGPREIRQSPRPNLGGAGVSGCLEIGNQPPPTKPHPISRRSTSLSASKPTPARGRRPGIALRSYPPDGCPRADCRTKANRGPVLSNRQSLAMRVSKPRARCAPKTSPVAARESICGQSWPRFPEKSGSSSHLKDLPRLPPDHGGQQRVRCLQGSSKQASAAIKRSGPESWRR